MGSYTPALLEALDAVQSSAALTSAAVAYVAKEGTTAGAGSLGLVNSTSAALTSGSATDGYYVNRVLELRTATGGKRFVQVTGYVGSTVTATFAAIADNVALYSSVGTWAMHWHSGAVVAPAVGTSAHNLTLDAKTAPAELTEHAAIGAPIFVTNATTGEQQYRCIRAVAASTVTVDRAWDRAPAPGDLYVIPAEHGVAQSGGAVGNIPLGDQSAAVCDNCVLLCTEGPNAGYSRRITVGTPVHEVTTITINNASLTQDWVYVDVVGGKKYGFWFDVATVTTAPGGLSADVEVQCVVTTESTAALYAELLHDTMQGYAGVFTVTRSGAVVTVRDTHWGTRTQTVTATNTSNDGSISTARTTAGVDETATVSPNWPEACTTATKYLIFGGHAGASPTDCERYPQVSVGVEFPAGTFGAAIALARVASASGSGTGSFQIKPAFDIAGAPMLAQASERYMTVAVIGVGALLENVRVAVRNQPRPVKASRPLTERASVAAYRGDIVRSFMSGVDGSGRLTGVRVDGAGHMMAALAPPTGELLTTSHTPFAQIKFVYNLNSQLVRRRFARLGGVEVTTLGAVGTAQVVQIYMPDPANFATTTPEYFFIHKGSVVSTDGFHVWFDTTGSLTIPTAYHPHNTGQTTTGIEVDISASTTAAAVATAVATAVGANANFSASASGSVVTITNVATGAAYYPTTPTVSGLGRDVTTGELVGEYSSLASTVATVTSKPAARSAGYMESVRMLTYRPGQGGLARFSANFPQFVSTESGAVAVAGIGNPSGGFYFGRWGATPATFATDMFGIVHLNGGKPEVRTLTITSASGSSGNVIVRLAGQDYVVNVGGLDSAAEIAMFIADGDFSYGGWRAEAAGSTVRFISTWNEQLVDPAALGPRSTVGTDSVQTITGSSVSTFSALSFSTTTVGVAPTVTYIPQAEWNLDRMDGTGPSGAVLDPTKGNVYQVFNQWHGFGGIVFCVENADTTQLDPVHVIKYANTATAPSLLFPNVRLQWIRSAGSATAAAAAVTSVVNATSGALFLQGTLHEDIPEYRVISAQITPASDSTDLIALVLRMPETFGGELNTVVARLKSLSLHNDGTKTAVFTMRRSVVFMLSSMTTASATPPNFAAVDSEGALEYWAPSQAVSGDITVSSAISSATTVGSFPIGATSSADFDLRSRDILIGPGESVVLLVKRYASTVIATVEIIYVEDQ
jgi:hypothetical protein